MKNLLLPAGLLFGGLVLPASALAQTPDLLNSLDPGSPSLGAGGAFSVTNADTFSTYFNPASLGYVTRRTIGTAYRNLPESQSRITGNFADPSFSTKTERGANRFTHFGYVQPIKGGGSFGLSYTLGGYLDDLRFGTGLQVGNLTLNNYAEQTTVQPSFYSLAYGRANKAGNASFGLALVLASQNVRNRVVGVLTNPDNSTTPFNNVNLNETGTGVGVLLGGQFSPTGAPNTSIGVSVRTPISLRGTGDTGGLSSRIPGVFRVGYATRVDSLRKGREDFLVYGLHLAHYFGGQGSSPLDRSSQTTVGLGAEYSLSQGSAAIPLRIGYMMNPRGGRGFAERNAITLGIGYRPAEANYTFDLAYVLPRSGGKNDLALTASYRFR